MIELQKFQICYLATPYRKYPQGPQMAFIDAARLAGRLMLMNVHVYSPIAHGHPLTLYGGVPPNDYSIWHPANFRMARLMDALIVGMLPHWEHSEGIAEEVNFFKADEKPIFYLDPQTMASDVRAA